MQWLFAATLFFAALGAQAKLGVAYQMLLGNPSGATTDAANTTNYLMQRDQYALSFNNTTGDPNWVAWNLTPEDTGSSGRSSSFFEDPDLPAGYYRVQPNDYGDTGYDRGHMCPSGDRTVSRADNDKVFYMTNMIPQASWNNQGVWNTFEQYCRTVASQGNELLIMCGPSGLGSTRINSGKAVIPAYTWKIVVVVPNGTGNTIDRITTSTRVIAIKVPNGASGTKVTTADEWKKYLTTVNQIQQDTGYTFFTALPSGTAAVLRTMVDGQAVAGAPIIDTQPVAQTVAAGGTANFSVTASGDATLTYQWSFEGQPINGATSSTLTINNTGVEQMGSYRVTVSNSLGSVTSDAVQLTVTGIAPSFVTQPVSQTVNAGSNVTFTSLAAGSPTMTYQWRKNSQPILGATSASLTLTNVQSAAADTYDVVATNSVTSTTSNAVTLTVTPRLPVITTQPASRSAGLNGNVSFTVGVVGTEPFTYQWRKGGSAITDNASASTATLVLTGITEASVGSYDVVITNSVNSVTSDSAVLTISSVSNGALNYTGGTYSQDFNSLNATQGYDSDTVTSISGNGPHQLTATPFNGTELGGWWIVKYGGSGSNARFKADDGTAVNGAVYSYGASGANDRALGSLGSGSTQSRFGLVLSNNTGQTLTQFTISYVGEQWRDGSSAANTLAFSYAIDATDIATGTFTAAPSLNFTAPIAGTTETALDGNLPANRRAVSATVSGIVWPAGSRLLIRWTDADDILNDDGIAIDDFSFAAQNSGPVAPAVVSTTPADGATNISAATTINVTFNQPVTLASGAITLTSAAQGALSATVTGGPTSYTITPSATMPVSDTVTVSVLADHVTDQATGTLHLAENYDFSFATVTPVAPSITTHPLSQTVTSGSNVTFTVVPGGTAPFTYQWRKGGQNILNATSATLTLTNVQAGDAGNYDVIVTNSVSSVTSNAATLTVNVVTTSAITWNFTTNADPSSALPSGVTGGTIAQGNNNGTTTLLTTTSPSVNATSGVAAYTGASGTNNAGLAARVGALNQAAGGSAYFTFTLTPATGSRLLATGLSFGTRSTGTGPQAYALYSSVDNFAAAVASGTISNNSTWALLTATGFNLAGSVGTPVTFRLYGYNGAGSPGAGTANWRIDDLSLSVAVQTPPAITTHPAAQSKTVGDSVTFSVTATGSNPLTYQWRFKGDAIGGATGSSLSLSNVQLTDAGNYDVVVTNPVASVASNAAALTVTAPLSRFDTWRAQYFDANELANAAVSGPNVVLTADGMTNFLKYALGLNPRVAATAGVPVVGATATDWTFTFTRPADRDDVVYTVQASANLSDWTTIVVTASKLGTANGVDTWQATYPKSSASKLFFRLKVAPAP